MNNFVIEVQDDAHGQKVKEYLQYLGVNIDGFGFDSTKRRSFESRFYGVISDIFDNYKLNHVVKNKVPIIHLPSEYPKVCMVTDDFDKGEWHKQVVTEAKPLRNSEYIIGPIPCASLIEAETRMANQEWKYSIPVHLFDEVQALQHPVKELTMDEIAEKFGVPVGQLKIKK